MLQRCLIPSTSMGPDDVSGELIGVPPEEDNMKVSNTEKDAT